jgi:hypothetical protein
MAPCRRSPRHGWQRPLARRRHLPQRRNRGTAAGTWQGHRKRDPPAGRRQSAGLRGGLVSLSESLPVIVTRAEPGASETMARAGGDGCSADCVSHAVACPAGRGEAGSLRRAASRLYQRQWPSASSQRQAPCGRPRPGVSGPSTAGAAREAGFAAVYEGAGDAAALAADILVALPEGTEGVPACCGTRRPQAISSPG